MDAINEKLSSTACDWCKERFEFRKQDVKVIKGKYTHRIVKCPHCERNVGLKNLLRELGPCV